MALAYFLTFTTYGTWLHGTGKGRGSVNRQHRDHGQAFASPDPAREASMRTAMTQPSYTLDQARRKIVCDAMIELARERRWRLWAVHVRSTHVHVVLSAEREAGRLMSDLKARASRELNRAGFEEAGRKRWTRHGSTRHLFEPRDLEAKVAYTLEGQGPPMACFDGRE